MTEHLHDLLRRHAPFSTIDRGVELASQGAVLESSKVGQVIHGVVRDSHEDYSTRIYLIPSGQAEAECSCSTKEDMQEQWCVHAVSLTTKAHELGFFDSNTSPQLRLTPASPEEIAESFRALAVLHDDRAAPIDEISLAVAIEGDVLGIRVVARGEVLKPNLISPTFKRGLDTVLYDLVLREGAWDEEREVWFITGTPILELLLGILREYPEIRLLNDDKGFVVSRDFLDAFVEVEWGDTSATIYLYWITPDGKEHEKTSDILGTGPCWVPFESAHRLTLYPLSPRAVKLAGLFPNQSSITIPRSQTGAILEVLEESPPFGVRILNPQKQPKTKCVEPTASLILTAADSSQDHFVSQDKVALAARLDFTYPESGKGNVVYLPHRAFEAESRRFLETLGLTPRGASWLAEGDVALDFLSKGISQIPNTWKIQGLSEIKEKIRTTDLKLHVSVSASKQEIDWFDCLVNLSAGGAPLPLSTLFRVQRNEDHRWVRLDGGAYAELPGGSLRGLKTMLGLLDVNLRTSASIKTKISKIQALSLVGLEEERCSVSIDKQLAGLAQKLRDFSGIPPLKLRKGFEGTLRPYQKDGVRWLTFLKDCQLSGILADEMGLGKTVQTLAFLNQHKSDLPTIVIAPTSVIPNWEHEAKKFTPELKALLLHGPKRKSKFHEIPKADIVITSYALLRTDRSELEQYQFNYVILDEAQNIKNPQAATTKAAKALRSKNRLALTGTPTENRPLELWSIMDFLMPGYLGTSEFFRNNIERLVVSNHSDPSITRFLTSKTRPFILRRRKKDVEKQLPPKIESTEYVEMTPSQEELYNTILSEIRPKLFDSVKKKGIGASTVSILAALLRLRQVCNHPNSISAFDDLPGYDSGKFLRWQELIQESIDNQRKIIVYSQFRDMLRLMREWVETKNIPYLYLDGTTQDRQSLIDKFNTDSEIPLFLMSLKAGGTGINLTGADTVMIYDPWWNPAVEDQAVDRAHRIGQTKPVNVYRLVTVQSVEEKMLELKNRKSAVVDAIINKESLQQLKLTVKDLENLFAPLKAE